VCGPSARSSGLGLWRSCSWRNRIGHSGMPGPAAGGECPDDRSKGFEARAAEARPGGAIRVWRLRSTGSGRRTPPRGGARGRPGPPRRLQRTSSVGRLGPSATRASGRLDGDPARRQRKFTISSPQSPASRERARASSAWYSSGAAAVAKAQPSRTSAAPRSSRGPNRSRPARVQIPSRPPPPAAADDLAADEAGDQEVQRQHRAGGAARRMDHEPAGRLDDVGPEEPHRLPADVQRAVRCTVAKPSLTGRSALRRLRARGAACR
jgi:hypothetical protein